MLHCKVYSKVYAIYNCSIVVPHTGSMMHLFTGLTEISILVYEKMTGLAQENCSDVSEADVIVRFNTSELATNFYGSAIQEVPRIIHHA